MIQPKKNIVIENKYYQIHYLLTDESGKWLARVRVTRKDTDEYINNGFTLYDHDKEEVIKKVIKKINLSLMPQIEALGVPLEWNTEVRRILSACSNHRNSIFKFSEYCNRSSELKIDEDEFGLEYAKFWQNSIKETSAITYSINKLSSEERLNLLIPPDYVYTDPSDIWSLEELDNRRMIFDYFGNHTNKEKEVHKLQKEKL